MVDIKSKILKTEKNRIENYAIDFSLVQRELRSYLHLNSRNFE